MNLVLDVFNFPTPLNTDGYFDTIPSTDGYVDTILFIKTS